SPSLRVELRMRYPWIAAAIALLIWAPNLAWQVAEGFPSLIHVASHRGSGGGPIVFVIEFVVYFFFLSSFVAGGHGFSIPLSNAAPGRNCLRGSAASIPLRRQVLLRGRSGSDRPGSRAHGDLSDQASKASFRPSDRRRRCKRARIRRVLSTRRPDHSTRSTPCCRTRFQERGVC